MEHVRRRGAVYQWRVRVPAGLVPVIGRREIVRSLATADPQTARARAAQCHAAAAEAWEQARVAGTADEVKQIVDYLLKLVEKFNNARIPKTGHWQRVSSLLVEQVVNLDDWVKEIRGIDLPRLVEAIKTAEVDATQTARTAAVASAMNPETLKQIETIFHGMGASVTTRPTPTVIEFLERTYTAEKDLRDDAQRHIDGYVRLFARITGNKHLIDYTRTDIIQWVRTLEKLKRTIGKSSKDRLKTIDQLVRESVGFDKLNKTTIEKHITHIRAMFMMAHKNYRWCQRDFIDDLFDDIGLTRSVPDVKKRKSWTMEKLNLLFATPIWTGTRSRAGAFTQRHQPGSWIHRDAYWWLPVVSLWTGARLEELCQLRHTDLRQDKDGIPYISINREAGKSTKNLHSIRNIPVHGFLARLGFMDLFEAGKRERIWPELKPHGRPPSYGGLYTSHFTDYRRACGLYEELLDFHSLRRTFISTLRDRLHVDPLTVAAMAGHDDGEPELRRVQQTDDYTDYSIAGLAEPLARLDYATLGLDVTPLLEAARICGPRESARVTRDLSDADPV